MDYKERKLYGKMIMGAVAISIFLTGCGTKTKETSKPVTSEMNISEVIEKKADFLLKDSEAFTVQYALYDNGNIITSGVRGKDVDKINKDTVYGIGSVSKVFAAAAVMKLVDEGKIDLEIPVYKYIPEFKMKDERYKKITPRMLLNHSSGLRGNDATNEILLDDNDTYANTNLLNILNEQTLKAEPGAYSVYCNSGFSLAEILVEKVSGVSFTEFLNENFMTPLQMKNTGTPQSGIDKSQFAKFHMEDGTVLPRVELCNAIGSGGVISTAEDMVKFSEIFMRKHKNILSDESVKKMENEEYKLGMWPGDEDDSNNYGLGWDSVKLYPFSEYGIKTLAKGGDISTYHASFVVLPEKNMSAMVLTTNGNSASNQALASEMLLLALKEKGDIKEFKESKSFGKPVAEKMPEEILNNAGEYIASESRYKVEISKEGKLNLSNDSDMKYIYVGEGKFVSEDGNAKLQFVKEKNGKSYLWKQIYINSDELPQMAESTYIGEKLVKQEIKPEVIRKWKDREGDLYYIVNEKYTSDSYLFGPMFAQVEGFDEKLGYWGDKKVIDENTAVSEVQIPGLDGRDTVEAKFYNENGNEYISHSGYIGINEKFMKSLKINDKVQIGKNGHAIWYTIPKELGNKTLTIEVPERAGFTVYNADKDYVSNSYISDKNTIVLPEDGKIVFAGNAGSEFKLKFK